MMMRRWKLFLVCLLGGTMMFLWQQAVPSSDVTASSKPPRASADQTVHLSLDAKDLLDESEAMATTKNSDNAQNRGNKRIFRNYHNPVALEVLKEYLPVRMPVDVERQNWPLAQPRSAFQQYIELFTSALRREEMVQQSTNLPKRRHREYATLLVFPLPNRSALKMKGSTAQMRSTEIEPHVYHLSDLEQKSRNGEEVSAIADIHSKSCRGMVVLQQQTPRGKAADCSIPEGRLLSTNRNVSGWLAELYGPDFFTVTTRLIARRTPATNSSRDSESKRLTNQQTKSLQSLQQQQTLRKKGGFGSGVSFGTTTFHRPTCSYMAEFEVPLPLHEWSSQTGNVVAEVTVRLILQNFQALDEYVETISDFSSFDLNKLTLRCQRPLQLPTGTRDPLRVEDPTKSPGAPLRTHYDGHWLIHSSLEPAKLKSQNTLQTPFAPWRGMPLAYFPYPQITAAAEEEEELLQRPLLYLKHWPPLTGRHTLKSKSVILSKCFVRNNDNEIFQQTKKNLDSTTSPQRFVAIRRIFFTGDSQVRTVFRHLEAILKPAPVSLAKGGNLKIKAPLETLSRSGRVVGSDPDSQQQQQAATVAVAQYIWDPYLDTLPLRWKYLLAREEEDSTEPEEVPYDIPVAADAIALGLGAWPASFGQWSLETFTDAILNVSGGLIRTVQEKAAVVGSKDKGKPSFSSSIPRPFYVIWLGSPAWPKPRKVPGFRITNARLGAFNTIGSRILRRAIEQHSEELATQSGIRLYFVDASFFHMSYSVPQWERGDGMHYDRSAVCFTAVDAILDVFCPGL